MGIEHVHVSSGDGCAKYGQGTPSIAFDFAFQPIVSLKRKAVVAHEALARGPGGEPARLVLDQVTWENRHRFDQEFRGRAIERAASLGMLGSLSINFIPNAVDNPKACIQRAIRTANERGFDLSRLVLRWLRERGSRTRRPSSERSANTGRWASKL
jgi:EAL domain-containing protein (putative c-di-GMP-specific phosphodiesterase class I)